MNAPRPPFGQREQRAPITPVGAVTSANYVDLADEVMRSGEGRAVTTSQLRNLLSLTADIYNRLQVDIGDDLPDDVAASLTYLRVQFVYAAGREPKVKDFVDKANLLDTLKRAARGKDEALLLCRYLEAMVAYKKYHYGKDA